VRGKRDRRIVYLIDGATISGSDTSLVRSERSARLGERVDDVRRMRKCTLPF
jgi:hypothetical protein